MRAVLVLMLLLTTPSLAELRPVTRAVTVNPTNAALWFPDAEQFGAANEFVRRVESDGGITVFSSGTVVRLHVDIPDVSEFLTQPQADLLYQEIGGEGGFLTRATADTLYQPLGDYQPAGDYALTQDLFTQVQADLRYQPLGNYQLAGDYATRDELFTEAQADLRYQPLGDYQPAGDYAVVSDLFTQAQADLRYQPIGAVAGATQMVINLVGQPAVTSTYDEASARLMVTEVPAPEASGGATGAESEAMVYPWTNVIWLVAGTNPMVQRVESIAANCTFVPPQKADSNNFYLITLTVPPIGSNTVVWSQSHTPILGYVPAFSTNANSQFTLYSWPGESGCWIRRDK